MIGNGNCRSANDGMNDRLVRQFNPNQDRIKSFAFVIVASVCILFSIGFTTSSLSGLAKSHTIELESRINPNNAPEASLMRLPGIGMGKAKAIIAYRTDFRRRTGNSDAFRNCEDLQKIKGIGPKTVKNINEWLKFK